MRQDRGAATVWALALTMVLVSVLTVVLGVGQVALIRSQVSTAADLAALAGAARLSNACAVADEVAIINGARLDDCGIDGEDVLVDVSAPAPPLVKVIFTDRIRAKARAGPQLDG